MNTLETTNKKPIVTRNSGIDLLRGLSILLVILLHCSIHMSLTSHALPQNWFNIIFRSGYYGVIIFFVISGFLITSTSLSRHGSLKDVSAGRFYRMRFSRIAPCLFGLIIILCFLDIFAVQGFVIHTTTLSQAVVFALTFQINWLEAKTGYLPPNWDVLWSLSVEEIFYLFFPLVCIILKKPNYFILAMLIFVIIGPFSRIIFTQNDLWSDHSYLSCMDGIAIGCIAALLSHHLKLNQTHLRLLMYFGVFFSTFILIFKKEAFDIGISKIGLNVTMLEVGIGLILMALQNDIFAKKNKRCMGFFATLVWSA